MVSETNAAVIAEFRANGGQVAAPYPDPPPMLLVHTIGRRSGNEHITPMRCLQEANAWYVFGTAHGSAKHPDWYLNLREQPGIQIEVGSTTLDVHATVLEGAERERIFNAHASRFPVFNEMQANLERQIPVVRLLPR